MPLPAPVQQVARPPVDHAWVRPNAYGPPPSRCIFPGTTQLEAGERCRGEKNGLEIIAPTIRPAEACGNQIIEPLLISGIGEPFSHLS